MHVESLDCFRIEIVHEYFSTCSQKSATQKAAFGATLPCGCNLVIKLRYSLPVGIGPAAGAGTIALGYKVVVLTFDIPFIPGGHFKDGAKN